MIKVSLNVFSFKEENLDNMKKAQIVHNPTSGNGEHSEAKIRQIVEKVADVVGYVSTNDEDWEKDLHKAAEIYFLAGGDGTVHKLAKELLQNEEIKPGIPVYLLPYGTANNIGLTLGIPKLIEELEENFEERIGKFDVGKVDGLGNLSFFLEGVGFGIFPELIKKMEGDEKNGESASQELQRTLKRLLMITKKFKAQKAELNIDGVEVHGSFLLVELINVKFIGPNFQLAPNADPGDGYFDMVLIPETRRADLVSHLQNLIDGNEEPGQLKDFVQHLRVQQVKMKWEGKGVHVDDDLVEDYDRESFVVSVDNGRLSFVRFQ